MSEEPLTARDLCAIIRRWLETDDPTHWGDFERGLFDLITAASKPGASAQASDEARDNGRIGDAEHEDDELAQDSERGE